MRKHAKMFGTRGRFGSLKKEAFKMFRLIRGVATRDFNSSSYTVANEDLKQPKTFNLQAHILQKRRMHEIEKMKAMIIMESRHERWKAGGPV